MRTYTSNKISNLSWICSVLIVFIHATTYAFNLPGAQLETVYGRNISTFVQMVLAEGICRIAVPLFFVFSGYLFFQNFEFTAHCIMKKFKKRIFSLVVPYLFWSSGTFIFFYVAQSIPATARYFSSRPVVGVGLTKTLEYILFESLNSPLWYLRNLIILTIFTPVIYVLMKSLWYIAVPLACTCGIFDIGTFSVRGSAICAFCVGSFFAVQSNRLQHWKEYVWRWKGLLTVFFSVMWFLVLFVKSIYLCTLPVDVLLNGWYTNELNVLSTINILVGIPCLWLLYDWVYVHRKMGESRFCKYGMMLYVMHHPIVSIIKKVSLVILGNSIWRSLVCYFVSAGITIVIVLIFSYVLRKYARSVYALISGGR